MLTNRLIN